MEEDCGLELPKMLTSPLRLRVSALFMHPQAPKFQSAELPYVRTCLRQQSMAAPQGIS